MSRRRRPDGLRRSMLAGVLVAVTLIGCNHAATPDDGEAPPASPVMAVSGAPVRIAPMSSVLRLIGTTAAQQYITLRAPAAGRLVGFNLQVGERVGRGQVVAHLINREVEAAANGLAVARKIDPAEAQALSDAVKRSDSPAAIAVTVPEAGIVSQLMVGPGQMVADLDPLANLIDPHSLYIEAALPLTAVAAIRPGMAATVITPLRPGKQYRARVATIAPSLAAGAATVPLRIELVGPDRIEQTAAPVEIKIITAYFPAALAVPEAALFEDAANGQHYVFAADAAGLAHRTEVTIGVRDGALTQIIKGLHPGQVVITSGGYALADGLRVKVALTP